MRQINSDSDYVQIGPKGLNKIIMLKNKRDYIDNNDLNIL